MEVRVNGLRRAAKNITHNYTEPQKKVREATSNDPWGPSSTIMGEISDLTYNIEAFAQIMEMLWKRLNDSGKNWRHVYKSLVLIEYLIKTGSERVGQQCKENIFAIQTLKDFQHFEDNKDQGLNVREKAKQLVILLSSEEKLRTERTRALKARERFAQTASGFGSSDSNETTPTSPGIHPFGRSGNSSSSSHHHESSSSGYNTNTTNHSSRNPEIESARPHTHGEEELQLQLALAMSKEEAEQEEKQRRNDELRLQMALSQSEQEFKTFGPPPTPKQDNISSTLVDLLDVDLGGGHGGATALPPPVIGFRLPPSTTTTTTTVDPWGISQQQQQQQQSNPILKDPWANNTLSFNTIPINNKNLPDPWNNPQQQQQQQQQQSHPISINNDPWNTNINHHHQISPNVNDPWLQKDIIGGVSFEDDEFNNLSKRSGGGGGGEQQIIGSGGGPMLIPMIGGGGGGRMSISPTTYPINNKNPTSFLGENSVLVNLNNLLPTTTTTGTTTIINNPTTTTIFGSSPIMSANNTNPFGVITTNNSIIAPPPPPSTNQPPINPFHIQNNILKPSINEIRHKQQLQQTQNFIGGGGGGMGTGQSQSNNIMSSSSGQIQQQNNPWLPVSDK